MKKEPRPNEGLRELPGVVGMTQPKFAEFIGLPFSTFRAIAAGQRPLSASVADRIMIETGVHPPSLLQGHLSALNGEEYTPSHFAAWRKGVTEEDVQTVRETMKKVLLQVERTQELAKQKGRLLAFHYLYQVWLNETLGALGILESYRESFRQSLSGLADWLHVES